MNADSLPLPKHMNATKVDGMRELMQFDLIRDEWRICRDTVLDNGEEHRIDRRLPPCSKEEALHHLAETRAEDVSKFRSMETTA